MYRGAEAAADWRCYRERHVRRRFHVNSYAPYRDISPRWLSVLLPSSVRGSGCDSAGAAEIARGDSVRVAGTAEASAYYRRGPGYMAADVIFARLMSLIESGAYLVGATQFTRGATNGCTRARDR